MWCDSKKISVKQQLLERNCRNTRLRESMKRVGNKGLLKLNFLNFALQNVGSDKTECTITILLHRFDTR